MEDILISNITKTKEELISELYESIQSLIIDFELEHNCWVMIKLPTESPMTRFKIVSNVKDEI